MIGRPGKIRRPETPGSSGTSASLPITATQAGSTAAGTPLRAFTLTPASAGASQFAFELGGANFGGVEDSVAYFGWNARSGGSRIDTARSSIAWVLEDQYNDGGVDTTEGYQEFRDTTGTVSVRPFMFQFRRTPTRVVTDGVLNSTTTLTSATAAFLASDVGSAISGTGIPAGTTIAARASATSITLSQAATATASGVTLTIADRRTAMRQSILRGNPIQFMLPDDEQIGSFGLAQSVVQGPADYDFSVNAAAGTPSVTLKAAGTATFAINASGATAVNMQVGGTTVVKMSKTATLQQFAFGGNPYGIFTIDAAGSSGAGNPILQTVSRAVVVSGQDHYVAMDSSNNTLSRFDRNGYFMTRKVAAPADGDLVASELAIWLDATNGAAKAMFKAKQADGTVKTAAVALA